MSELVWTANGAGWSAGVVVDDDMEITLDVDAATTTVALSAGSLTASFDGFGDYAKDTRLAESLVPAFEAFFDAVNAAERKIGGGT